MPGMDATGPLGTGPIGRGLGPCGGGQAGWGRGRGFRRGGFGGWGIAPPVLSPEDQKMNLQQRKQWLEAQLATINKTIQDSEK